MDTTNDALMVAHWPPAMCLATYWPCLGLGTPWCSMGVTQLLPFRPHVRVCAIAGTTACTLPWHAAFPSARTARHPPAKDTMLARTLSCTLLHMQLLPSESTADVYLRYASRYMKEPPSKAEVLARFRRCAHACACVCCCVRTGVCMRLSMRWATVHPSLTLMPHHTPSPVPTSPPPTLPIFLALATPTLLQLRPPAAGSCSLGTATGQRCRSRSSRRELVAGKQPRNSMQHSLVIKER